MNKIVIRENYENYERVKKTFKDFIHTLVWESIVNDDSVNENKVNDHIERYCNTMGDGVIHDINRNVTKYINSFYARYSVHCYEYVNGEAIEEDSFNTNNESLALKKAAEFYRGAACPKVTIYDNATDNYLAEWV
jgi:hypothetical protein